MNGRSAMGKVTTHPECAHLPRSRPSCWIVQGIAAPDVPQTTVDCEKTINGSNEPVTSPVSVCESSEASGTNKESGSVNRCLSPEVRIFRPFMLAGRGTELGGSEVKIAVNREYLGMTRDIFLFDLTEFRRRT
jgi:hypothetical protein